MDDLPRLLQVLKASPQPLTPEEERTLNMIKKALNTTTKKIEHSLEDLAPSPIESIQEPKFEIEQPTAPDTKTIYETNEYNVIRVGENEKYKTISNALKIAKENDTIILCEGTYEDEELTALSSVHFCGEGRTILKNIRVISRASSITFKGIRLESDDTIFTLNRGLLGLMDCDIIGNSTSKPLISFTSSASVEMNKCNCDAQHIIETRMSTNLNFLNSKLNGTCAFCKSDATFNHCSLDGGGGPSIESVESTVKVYNSLIKGSQNVAATFRDKSNLTINSTLIQDIQGTGILLHGFSVMKANCIRFKGCSKTCMIVANDSQANITNCSFMNSGLSACEILFQGSVEMNETWISNTNGSCILCDNKSNLTMTRCRICKSNRHGIEAGNGSVLRLNDTIIDECQYFGILSSNAKVIGKSCELSSNKDTNLYSDDHSWIDFTNCNFLKSKGDGLSADTETMVICNHSYFVENEGHGIVIRTCRDAKFQNSVFYKNKLGGLLFEASKQMVVDECIIDSNSMVITNVANAVVRLTSINHAVSKNDNNESEHIEINHNSNIIFEDNSITSSAIKVRNATSTIRSNKFSHSSTFAISGEYYAHLTIESNDMDKNKAILSLKDNSDVHFFNNKISSIKKSKSDNKQRVIHVRAFSKGYIEGNTISGDYDCAIFIDVQSNVDTRANQIQCGTSGAIAYTGESNGICEDNKFTGKDQTKTISIAHGCNVTLR